MKLLRHAGLFVLMLGFWLLLSGHYDPLFISMGVVSATVATWFGGALLEHTIGPAHSHPRVRVLSLLVYVGWLVARIIPSAIQVARIVLDPRLPPEPGMVRFRTRLNSPAARTTLANSITLVPGTMTIDVEGDEFTVHAFTHDAVKDLATGRMQNRIARVFRDTHQPEPELHWESGHHPRGMEEQA